MRLRILDSARSEAQSAYEWYWARSPIAADRFADNLDASIQRLQAFPWAWPEVRPNLRRCVLVGFPFAILYRIDADELVIAAVADLRRAPD